MAYTPTEWENGEALAATKFNKMENGLKSADSSYVPTEWTPGDVITAEALNKIENGIADAVEASVTVESLSVNSNGTYTALPGKAYSPVAVSVPNSYAAGDEGKVVSNGALVAQTSDTVTENGTVDTTLINSLEVNVSGGGGNPVAEEKDVNFIDYDGTIRYSYTAQEFAALDALPANPDHTDEGLTAQGWNWSLSDAKDQAAEACPIWIGQMYVTTSGNTEIDVCILEGKKDLYLNFCVNGTAKVNWGDNSADDTVTGTALNSPKHIAHTYATTGKYTISITVVSGTCALAPWSGSILTDNNYNTKMIVYSGMVQAVRFGSNMQLGAGGLNSCSSLKTISLPSNLVVSSDSSLFGNVLMLKGLVVPTTDSTSISNIMRADTPSTCLCSLPKTTGQCSFKIVGQQKRALKYVICKGVTSLYIGAYADSYNLQIILPSTLIEIGANSFSSHYALSELTIPASVTTIGNYALQSNSKLKELHFKPTTPPSAGTSAFSGLPTTCKIYVPTGSLSAYTSASNYPSSSTYTYIEE